MARKLQVEIVGDASALSKTFAKASRESGRFGSAMSSAGKIAAVGFGGALVGAGAALKVFGSEAIEAEKVAAQTEAVLKSTGAAAGVTASGIAELSGALMRKSGVDDEAIQSGANLLLTFTNIKNAAGAGNKVFDETTKTMLDMSVALGQDTKSSALQLGKALNDPIRGVSALQRVGVSFTESQRDTIKALVQSGKTMEAQKLILRELQTEFGGSAEAAGKTFAGQLDIAKQSLLNMGGEVLQGVMPAIAAFTGTITREVLPKLREWIGALVDHLKPAFSSIVAFVSDNWPTVQRVFGAFVEFFKQNVLPIWAGLFNVVKGAIGKVVEVLRDNEPGLRRIWENVQTVMRGVKTVIEEVVLPVLRLVFTEVLPRVIGVAIVAIEKVTGVLAGIAGFVTGAREKISGFFDWITKTALLTVRDLLEPFSHLPGKLGGWARDAKDGVNARLDEIRVEKAKGEIDALREKLTALGKTDISVPVLVKVRGTWIGGGDFSAKDAGDVAVGTFNAQLASRMRDTYQQIGGPTGGSGGGLAPQTAALLDRIRSSFGNVLMTSGFRTREQNTAVGGKPNSDHLTGRAFDLVPATGWNPATIAHFDRIAAFVASLPSVRFVGWRGVPGHGPGDHLHVSTFDRGGILPPGLTMAYNGTGRNEYVSRRPSGGDVNVHIGTVVGGRPEEIARALAPAIRKELIRNGRRGGPIFGGLA